MGRESDGVEPSVSGFKPGDGSRIAAGLAIALVVAAVVVLFVPVSPEGANDQTPSCGSIVVPADELRFAVECSTRHIRQIGSVGLLLAGAVGCTVLSVLPRVGRSGPESQEKTDLSERE